MYSQASWVSNRRIVIITATANKICCLNKHSENMQTIALPCWCSLFDVYLISMEVWKICPSKMLVAYPTSRIECRILDMLAYKRCPLVGKVSVFRPLEDKLNSPRKWYILDLASWKIMYGMQKLCKVTWGVTTVGHTKANKISYYKLRPFGKTSQLTTTSIDKLRRQF